MADNRFRELNMPIVDVARNSALQNAALQEGVTKLGSAFTGFADARYKQNTNSLLAQIAAAQTSGAAGDMQQFIQNQMNRYGEGVDALAVNKALEDRRSALKTLEFEDYTRNLAKTKQESEDEAGRQYIARGDVYDPSRIINPSMAVDVRGKAIAASQEDRKAKLAELSERNRNSVANKSLEIDRGKLAIARDEANSSIALNRARTNEINNASRAEAANKAVIDTNGNYVKGGTANGTTIDLVKTNKAALAIENIIAQDGAKTAIKNSPANRMAEDLKNNSEIISLGYMPAASEYNRGSLFKSGEQVVNRKIFNWVRNQPYYQEADSGGRLAILKGISDHNNTNKITRLNSDATIGIGAKIAKSLRAPSDISDDGLNQIASAVSNYANASGMSFAQASKVVAPQYHDRLLSIAKASEK